MIGPSRQAMEPNTCSGSDLPFGASPTGGAVLNVSDTQLSCESASAPARPAQHVRAWDGALSCSATPPRQSRLMTFERQHRGHRRAVVGPELAQLTWRR